MTPKATTPADPAAAGPRIVIVTLDHHLAGVVRRAQRSLAGEAPGLTLSLHAASDWAVDPEALARCRADIAAADIIIAAMLFMEDHVQAVLPALQARRDGCAAMFGILSAGEIIKLTRAGGLSMDSSDKGPLALLKRLRGGKGKSGAAQSSGSGQMAMLRRLPKILRFIPGPAQDLRAYFLTLQYWLSGSDENIAGMARFLAERYAAGAARKPAALPPPRDYPEVGVYHPRLPGRLGEDAELLPCRAEGAKNGSVGLIILRSYVLADDCAHYDAVIAAIEAKGLRAVPVFASGLDARAAIERYFLKDGVATVEAVISLAGFSLVGGPAYNDAAAAEEILARLDVPYIAAQPLEFQSLQAWAASQSGLTPLESTIMVAIPELDGATAPTVFAGRGDACGSPCTGCARRCAFPPSPDGPKMHPCAERAEALAARMAKLVALRRTARRQRRLGIVLFNFPPNAGAAGTAAYLSVFASLFNTLKALERAGYAVDVPPTTEELRARLLGGPETQHGMDAGIYARIAVDDHVRREPHLTEIERQWGPAPGRALTDGSHLFVLGARFGNVFVGLQPGFGYEGDPMRLMFERGLAPTHAFSAFYRWLREDFRAHAVLHFGTHGALEFMPGKQLGMSAGCWPERLIGDTPNVYLYAANNPSEGAIARRRSAATLVSHLTPSLARAGLYQGLTDLKASLDRWRMTAPATADRVDLAALIQEQAAALDLASAAPAWGDTAEAEIAALAARLFELEQTLIPHGLHVLGEAPGEAARLDLLSIVAEGRSDLPPLPQTSLLALTRGEGAQAAADRAGLGRAHLPGLQALAGIADRLAQNTELDAVIHALDGGYIRPAPGGDLARNPDVLPTGRNIHGFDPFRIPSAFAVRDGATQAERLLARRKADVGEAPESVAMVLWGSDNLKTEGSAIAQALALMGARPRFDSYGRLCGAALIPLADLGRARIDVVMTLSGIFRDLLALQVRMLAEAAYLAATADEPIELNYIRKHALEQARTHGCDMETAALRVFSNADGAYGANVNQLIDAGAWTHEDELADVFEARKCYAYGRSGPPAPQTQALRAILKNVDFTYQTLDCVELGVTALDQYVDTLGGVSRAVRRAKGAEPAVYVGDQTQGDGKVRTLAEQVALETRTRMLNPLWYEGMLDHGAEGVRQIEAAVTTTLGWSATTGQVPGWVYQRISETYVLDEAMRHRLASLNPKASARMANRLLEANDRKYWSPDEATLAALRAASDDLEDALEGVAAAAA